MTFEEYAEQHAPTAEEIALFEAQRQQCQTILNDREDATQRPAAAPAGKETSARANKLLDEVRKGARAGEDLQGLFLKAIEAAAMLAGRFDLLEDMQVTVTAIYGAQAGQGAADIERRLHRLEEALKEATPGDVQIIRRAITANKRRLRDMAAAPDENQLEFEEVEFVNDPF